MKKSRLLSHTPHYLVNMKILNSGMLDSFRSNCEGMLSNLASLSFTFSITLYPLHQCRHVLSCSLTPETFRYEKMNRNVEVVQVEISFQKLHFKGKLTSQSQITGKMLRFKFLKMRLKWSMLLIAYLSDVRRVTMREGKDSPRGSWELWSWTFYLSRPYEH